MKKKFDKRRLLPALTLAALALAVLAPFGWFAARDAALDGRRLLSIKGAGLLGEAGQQNALARRLYLDRSKAAAGYETRPANADETQWYADARRALEASALGVWMPEPAADAATPETAAGEEHELWVSEEGAVRRVAQSFTGSGDGLVLIFAGDGTLTGLQVNAAAPLAALELDKAADALAELAGLEAIIMECRSMHWIRRCSVSLNIVPCNRCIPFSVDLMICSMCRIAATRKCAGKIYRRFRN